MQGHPIDDAGALKALLVNLYTGWGYNAYRQENKDRADDLLVRNGVCGLLAEARAALEARASALRRAIAAPSREQPFPGAAERARIRDIESRVRDIEQAEALVRHLPVPENDSTWRRHRSERDFLPRLVQADEGLALHALRLRESARGDNDPGALDGAIAALGEALRERRSLLTMTE